MLDQEIAQILKHWELDLKQVRPDLEIAGSPERCFERRVVEDQKGRLYILEQLEEKSIGHKRRIQAALSHLAAQGLSQVIPYYATNCNDGILSLRGKFWQLLPFISGRSLKRPHYIQDGWRGRVLADFLIDLRERAGEVPGFEKESSFSIMNFSRDLAEKIKRREPVLFLRIQPALEFLESTMGLFHHRIPSVFCHGDYHPLNILWGDHTLKAVIDWEFLGIKPEIYDAANLIGCIGMEHPQGLVHDLVSAFITTLKQADIISDLGWKYLFHFVLALRFAWLSEWLRKPDPEMIDLEAVYIGLLLNNREKLQKKWEI